MKKLKLILFVIFIAFNSCNTSKNGFVTLNSQELTYLQQYTEKHIDTPNQHAANQSINRNNRQNIITHKIAIEEKKSQALQEERSAFKNAAKEKKFKEVKEITSTRNHFKNKGKSEKTSDNFFLMLTALTGIIFASIFSPFVSMSKKIAFYALDNRRRAIYIIGASHLGLGLAAVFLGRNLFDLGIRTTDFTAYTLAGFACTSVFFYPKRKVKSGIFKNTFTRQKIATFLVLFSGFSMMANMGVRTAQNPDYSTASTYIYKGFEKYFSSQSTAKTAHIDSVTQDKVDGDNRGYKVGLSVLLIVGSMCLLFLILLIACGLACSDMGALAAFVAIGGFALVIYLTVTAWRRIWQV